MSKANSPIKVLRTGLKRVNKGWTQKVWSEEGNDGVWYVCLEGALFGYCDMNKHGLTPAQEQAKHVVLQIIKERYGDQFSSIPSFNDAPERTKEEIEEVIKLAIIRLETSDEAVDEILDEDDFDDLLDYIENH